MFMSPDHPDIAPYLRACADARKKVESLARSPNARFYPPYHEAKLAAMEAGAGLYEAMIHHESKKNPVCTQKVEEYRAMTGISGMTTGATLSQVFAWWYG